MAMGLQNPNIYKDMEVKSIDSFECKDWLLNKHYAKRMCSISYAFGLFDENNILQGVCTFGTPSSPVLRDLWNNKYKLIELNRLVVNDGLKKNSLSFFVSRCLRIINSNYVVVSYADTSQNHHGYIYQATNWIYTGLSAKRTDWKIEGLEHLHGSTIADMSRGKENRAEYMREKYGDKFYLQDRPRKHRYFYFLGTKKQIKDMKKMLPYEIEKYPKGENKKYDASYKPQTQIKIFLYMKYTEGWALDITTNNKEHYYKYGVSLCGKANLKHHMQINRNQLGSKWTGQCAICCKKQRE